MVEWFVCIEELIKMSLFVFIVDIYLIIFDFFEIEVFN